jgi:outer membrane protein TolC
MKHFVLTATAWAALSWAAATSATAQTLDACQSKDVLQQRSLKADATLDGLVRTAALDHTSIQSRLSEQEAAQAGVDSAKWGYFPSPSITRERTNPIPTDPQLPSRWRGECAGFASIGMDGWAFVFQQRKSS